MAFTGIMCTEAEIDQRSGSGIDTNYTDVMKTAACLAAESSVNDAARYNFSDDYATINADVKYLLTDIVASIVAIQAITYNMKGLAGTAFTLREAENRVNILRDAVLRGFSILRGKKFQDFINAA